MASMIFVMSYTCSQSWPLCHRLRLKGEREPIMMMPTLHLRLLGDFSLIYADRQVTSLNTLRLQSLLAYLVLHRDAPQQRQHLAFLFWPDTTEAQARNNLRQLLHQLRQVFPEVEHFLAADTHTLYWHPLTPCYIDVTEFEQALAEASAATQRNDQHALQIYHTCVTTLQREMGVDPDPATREVYEQLIQHVMPTTQAIVHHPLFAATRTLIGREREWKKLHHAWQRATEVGPHFVLVTGEAGVGKSRLTEEFLSWASQQGAVTARARSYAA